MTSKLQLLAAVFRRVEWRTTWPLLPALLAVLVYLPSLAGTYVYDDDMVIAKNDFVKSEQALEWVVSPDHYYGREGKGLGGSKEQSYRPLATVSHILECKVFWGEDGTDVPGGFRLTSLYLHALNALLLTALASRLFGVGKIAAVAAGSLFAIHPVATEAVVVASFREDPLCLWFLLAGLLFYAVHGHRPGAAGIGWSLAGVWCFFAAMLSKEVGLVAMPLALAADYVFGRTPWRERQPGRELLRVGALVGVTALYMWIRFSWAYFEGEGTTPWPGGPQATRITSIWTMLPVFVHYARLFCLPDVLRQDYMIAARWSLWDPTVLASAFALLGVGALGVAAAWRSRVAGAGLVFTAFTLAPVSNLIPIRNICAERYLYVPLAGIALAGGIAAAWAWRRWRGGDARRWLMGGAAALVVLLGARTVWRVTEWRDNNAVWMSNIRDEPRSTRSIIGGAAYWNLRGSAEDHAAAQAREAGDAATATEHARLAAAHFATARLFCLQMARVPWKVPDPRWADRDNPAAAPLVEVYSDAQAERRRWEAWRMLAEIDWFKAERLRESGNEEEGMLLLGRARGAIEACRTIIEPIAAAGGLLERDFGIYDLHGRIYLKLPETQWRRFWSVRDRAYAASSQKRWRDAVKYNREALALGTDPDYRAELQPITKSELDDERWRVFLDLGRALDGVAELPDTAEARAAELRAEADQVFGLAVEEAQNLRRAGRWPVADPMAWLSIAGAAIRGLPEADRVPAPQMVRGMAADRAVVVAAPHIPLPDRETAMNEARRLAALGHWRGGHTLAQAALAAPGAEPGWAERVDAVWIALGSGASIQAETLVATSTALAAHAQRGGTPFEDAWAAEFARFQARAADPDPAADQLAVALLLRARWLATSRVYADAIRALPNSEASRLAADAWRIEHELWWWYRHALGDQSKAAEHGRAALDSWARLVESGQAGSMAQDPGTFEKLRDCAWSAGDDAAYAAHEAERVRLGGR